MSSRLSAPYAPLRGAHRRAALRAQLGVDDPAARALLERARRQRQVALDAEAALLVTAWEWALAHVVDPDDPEVVRCLPGREGAVEVAGEGAPLVAEFCLAELGATLGISTTAARSLVGGAVELAHRLPLTWEAMRGGRLVAFRARRIARATAHLPLDAATHVDEQVHGVAQTVSLVAVDRLVTEAQARFDPAAAAEAAATAAEHRHVDLTTLANRTDGLVDLDGLLDAADAHDFETLLADVAHRLLAVHPDLSLDVRRSLALGYIGRGQEVPDAPAARPRQVVVHVHLHESSVRGSGALARVERDGLVVDADRVRAWLDVPQASVAVKPVLDLAAQLSTTAYEVPDRLVEQAVQRDVTCVFPWCSRPARGCDTDHAVPWDSGGPTATHNLEPLCRSHHRHKTHARWRIEVLGPGRYAWTSPHGLRYLRDHTGTRPLEQPEPVAAQASMASASTS